MISNNQLSVQEALQEVLNVPDLTNIPEGLKEVLKDQLNNISQLIKGFDNNDVERIFVSCIHIRYLNIEILKAFKMNEYVNNELENWIKSLNVLIEMVLKIIRE